MQFAGTPVYMAPELFQKRQYDEKVDVFAFGALLWELAMREVPYDGLDPADIRAKVEKGEPLKLRTNMDPQLQPLINACREVDYTKRCNFDRIVQVLGSLR
jgi:serine/threonine protein kinase